MDKEEGASMSDFLARMKAAAKADKKTIVLPEGEDPRTIAAAKQIIAEGLANLIILGDPKSIHVEGVRVIDPKKSDRAEAYAEKFAELRAKKGVTLDQAREQVKDNTYFATMMVKMGNADGLVSGACHSTANTLRPALQILKTAPGTKLVSGFMVICVPDCAYGQDGNFIFSDIGLNIDPDADQLSDIAIASAASWKQFMGTEPKVALLSYSTKGSAKGDSADKVRAAIKLVNERAPELAADGELQLDAALDKGVASLKAPGSDVAGTANVLIFPDLESGNIGYKLVQRLGKAEAYGPILQGIAKPVNDLSRGCSASDIVGVVAITAFQAQQLA
jgi:phosphate acetyltransferase